MITTLTYPGIRHCRTHPFLRNTCLRNCHSPAFPSQTSHHRHRHFHSGQTPMVLRAESSSMCPSPAFPGPDHTRSQSHHVLSVFCRMNIGNRKPESSLPQKTVQHIPTSLALNHHPWYPSFITSDCDSFHQIRERPASIMFPEPAYHFSLNGISITNHRHPTKNEFPSVSKLPYVSSAPMTDGFSIAEA